MSLIFPTMILSYYLFLSSLASSFSLDHRKVNLATIIPPTITAQTQRGGLSTLSFISSRDLCSCFEIISPTQQPDTIYSSSDVSPELATILFCFIIYREAKPRCLYYFLIGFIVLLLIIKRPRTTD